MCSVVHDIRIIVYVSLFKLSPPLFYRPCDGVTVLNRTSQRQHLLVHMLGKYGIGILWVSWVSHLLFHRSWHHKLSWLLEI